MDSRVKRQVIACAITMIALIVAVVVGADKIKTQRENERRAAREAAEEERLRKEAEEAEKEALKDSVYTLYSLDPHRDYKAFLKDDLFFDPEVKQEDPRKEMSVFVSSIMRDLRVNIVNGFGQLISGDELTVSVWGSDGVIHKYKDADKDGSVYIAPIDPGDYELSISGNDAYEMEEGPVHVRVKDQVDYTVINDISYMIKTEDEIDATVEDTAVNEAEQDADGTEKNEKLKPEDALFGIDVSKWNKEIDWNAVKADGVDFAIIRCGYRGSKSGALVEDPYFKKNIKEATEAGVKVGIYFFTQAVNEVEAVEEASMALMLIKDYDVDLPVFIDTEGAGGAGRADALDKDMRTRVCDSFCKTVENSGYKGGVYASKNWLINNIDPKELKDHTIWLAQYSSKATYDGDYDLWQYTSAGTIDGIGTRVDLNLSYRQY